MQIAFNKAPELIGVALHHELDRMFCRLVHFINFAESFGIALTLQTVHEGWKMEPFLIKKLHPLRRRVD